MGYLQSYIEWMEILIEQTFPSNKNPLSMLELGNQKITGMKEVTGKEYFIKKGFNHVSVDLNGLDGALIKDLSDLEHFIEFKDKFEIVTNGGTLEHVEPFESQYEAFLNVHNSLKIGGIALHIAPDIDFTIATGKYRKHCRYFYSEDFFDTLVNRSDYIKLSSVNLNWWRGYCYQKLGNKFIDRNTLLSKIHINHKGPLGGAYIDGKDKHRKDRTL